MTAFDTCVIGHGVAGAAVAWRLRWAGRTVAVIDRADPAAASRAAAGLVTPITGQRFAVTDRFAECRPRAEAFYRRVVAETGGRFFHADGAVRLFADAADRAAFDRRAESHLRGLVGPTDPEPFAAPYGAFGMPAAARLDVGRYLDASLRHFPVLKADIDPAGDIELSPDGVRLPRLDLTAGAVVFCQGYAAAGNPWFPQVRVNPVKGEVLTLSIPGLEERRAVHRGVWLVPAGDGLFRAGATYDRGSTDPTPTQRGRDEILAGLREFLTHPFEVVEHRAGVRPVVPGHRPVVAVSPRSHRVWCLNGLASKGVLYAPVFAAELVAHQLFRTCGR